ncbi:IclR family transcriptional regulator [Nocardioides sp. GY 10127]|uniref:IclR family transcriptional regulator n=1 Tax=Nocardioides sp. GY 10127 TaxID=2569762 RepID=UPI0010A8BF34|nr:IclR family transcriptional regulator [Nocardioides sp. GY 10127]TIC81920.1 IclR family transcriptional regulator [Nocardioides sp. GY 10127]
MAPSPAPDGARRERPDRETGMRRGLDVLLALGLPEAVERGGLGVMAICEITGREKSQVSRSLATLAEYGMVDRDPGTLAYRLGWRFFAMAQLAGDRRLLDDAPAVLDTLVADLGESAFLSVRQGDHAVTLVARRPGTGLQASAWVGQTFPLPHSSVGRVLLADADEDEVRAMFTQADLAGGRGPHAVRGPDDLAARVLAARREGSCTVDGEFEEGLLSIAAPVRDTAGRTVAAVNVSGPRFRMVERLDEVVDRVRAAGRALSSWAPEHADGLASTAGA